MDQLEEFIRKNRAAFDDKQPPGGAWQNIARSLGFQQRSLWNSVVIWRAAAIIFMMATGALLVVGRNNFSTTVASKPLTEISDFGDVEKFYVKQISEKVQLIDKFQQNEGMNGFTQDFQQLEAMYMVLKEEMKSSPSEKVKDALVLNLLVRIDLLNQRLHKLENEVKTQKQSNEKDRSV